MYGQFHNEQTLRSVKTPVAPKRKFTKTNKKKLAALISLFLISLSIATTSFAGPSQPRLPRGNGDANGR